MDDINIVVIGAGVVGLTTALILSENPRYRITIAAKHMPGDYDIDYASPWAGADYTPFGAPGSPAAQRERDTYPYLYDLAKNHPESGVHFLKHKTFNRKKDINKTVGGMNGAQISLSPWWKDIVADFKVIESASLPDHIHSVVEFTSVCISTPIHLAYLVSKLLATRRVVFQRAIFRHILDVANFDHNSQRVDIIVNCTGLSARNLGGVMDEAMVPARGQTVLVRNTCDWMGGMTGTDDAEDEGVYLITRAAGGGTILGGCYQKGDSSSDVDYNLASRIMKRVVELCPELTAGKGVEALDIVKHNVGLRPLRLTGTRIEREIMKTKDGKAVQIVHNYGHGGFGYQTGYGSAKVATALVQDAVGDLDLSKSSKARL